MNPRWLEHLTLHEVLSGFANKGALALNADATRTGVGARVLLINQAWVKGGGSGIGAERVHFPGDGHHVLNRLGKGKVRVAL